MTDPIILLRGLIIGNAQKNKTPYFLLQKHEKELLKKIERLNEFMIEKFNARKEIFE